MSCHSYLRVEFSLFFVRENCKSRSKPTRWSTVQTVDKQNFDAPQVEDIYSRCVIRDTRMQTPSHVLNYSEKHEPKVRIIFEIFCSRYMYLRWRWCMSNRRYFDFGIQSCANVNRVHWIETWSLLEFVFNTIRIALDIEHWWRVKIIYLWIPPGKKWSDPIDIRLNRFLEFDSIHFVSIRSWIFWIQLDLAVFMIHFFIFSRARSWIKYEYHSCGKTNVYYYNINYILKKDR